MAAAENRDSFGRLAYILVKFSLPLMLSGILQQLYNWADAFIVGNVVGEDCPFCSPRNSAPGSWRTSTGSSPPFSGCWAGSF